MIRWALRNLPRPWLIRLSYLVQWVAPVLWAGKRFTDPIDGRSYRRFLPYGYGNQIRENALAPGTNSLERHRLLWLYLQRFTNFFESPQHVLHIAPEQCFHGRFKRLNNLTVLTGDIESPLADLHFDLHHIPLEDNRFDVAFCNHVLEHVTDDAQCLRELYRVLKPGGWGIFQVPFVPTQIATDEDPSITDPAERERRFGQYDHVRIYGQDYPERLRAAGFDVACIHMDQHLAPEDFERYRLPVGEPLYICSKPVA